MTNVDLIKAHLAAYSASRWEEHDRVVADNVVYEEYATGTFVKGRDGYLDAVKRWKIAFPDLRVSVLYIFGLGEYVIAEVEWTGTQTGPLEGPFGVVPPTGRRDVLRSVGVFRVVKGKICELRHYFDVLTLLRQLGSVPRVSAPSQSAEVRTSATSA